MQARHIPFEASTDPRLPFGIGWLPASITGWSQADTIGRGSSFGRRATFLGSPTHGYATGSPEWCQYAFAHLRHFHRHELSVQLILSPASATNRCSSSVHCWL